VSQIQRASHRPRIQPAADPHARKSDRTRRAILDAALEFLWSRPFRELTIAELMSIPGISRSAFYRYFRDLHELMETLLQEMGGAILEAATPWFHGDGDPLPFLSESLAGLVRVSYDRGPILRAVADAAATDKHLEEAWNTFLRGFDDAVTDRIEEQQAKKLIPAFNARPVAVALNRLDASVLIHAFGRRPRGDPDDVYEALFRVWSSTLYAAEAQAEERRMISIRRSPAERAERKPS